MMQSAVAKNNERKAAADLRLRLEFETALADYTRSGRTEDAKHVKEQITSRWGKSDNAGLGPSTAPGSRDDGDDLILDRLLAAKEQFVAAVRGAQADFLLTIESRANAATKRGDLDAYKALTELKDLMTYQASLPDNVKDTAIRGAHAKFVRQSATAERTLRAAYQSAISEYTKAQLIDQAEAVKSELDEGGWFGELRSRRSIADLIPHIDLVSDTIRKGFRIREGRLEPTAWDNEHGPGVHLPVSLTSSYELDVTFFLTKGQPGVEELYLRTPVGSKWILVSIDSRRQTISCFPGPLGHNWRDNKKNLATGVPIQARLGVLLLPGDRAQINLSISGEPCISWEGPLQDLSGPPAPMWDVRENSIPALYTKSAVVTKLKVSAASGMTLRE